nr:hypothetical protein [uncultured Roseovarius sp.]
MGDDFSGIAALVVGALAIWFIVWLYILLPARMAQERNRAPLIWVLISFVGSPILAILLLIALGDAKE